MCWFTIVYIYCTLKKRLSQAVCQIKSSSDVNMCLLVFIESVKSTFLLWPRAKYSIKAAVQTLFDMYIYAVRGRNILMCFTL